MSGSTIVLAARADSAVTRLIAALGALPDAGFERFVVVGGLAVFCRIGSAHRATNDLDTVIDNDDDTPVIAMLARRGLELHGSGVFVDGTKVDVIEINPIDPEQLPEEPGPRLFVAAHRFTYDSAETDTIRVIDPDTGVAVATSEVELATPAGLVACKRHAYPHRRVDVSTRPANKRETLSICTPFSNDTTPQAISPKRYAAPPTASATFASTSPRTSSSTKPDSPPPASAPTSAQTSPPTTDEQLANYSPTDSGGHDCTNSPGWSLSTASRSIGRNRPLKCAPASRNDLGLGHLRYDLCTRRRTQSAAPSRSAWAPSRRYPHDRRGSGAMGPLDVIVRVATIARRQLVVRSLKGPSGSDRRRAGPVTTAAGRSWPRQLRSWANGWAQPRRAARLLA